MIETPLKLTNEEDGIFYVIETQDFSLDGASASVICLVSSHLCLRCPVLRFQMGTSGYLLVQPSIGGNVAFWSSLSGHFCESSVIYDWGNFSHWPSKYQLLGKEC